MYKQITFELTTYINNQKADFLPYFFKTGKGQYGEGDKFIGVVVPNIRKVAKQFFKEVDFKTIDKLLHNKIHEHRLLALIMLVYKFEKADEILKHAIYKYYLDNTKWINNWDLVDLSARDIIGSYLLVRERKPIYKLAHSKDLWENRIAIIATYAFIMNKEWNDTFAIAEILLNHKHDLIHKAVGWMLREVGKRVSEEELKKFLNEHYKKMPRTMLRYSIEKLNDSDKKFFMSK